VSVSGSNFDGFQFIPFVTSNTQCFTYLTILSNMTSVPFCYYTNANVPLLTYDMCLYIDYEATDPTTQWPSFAQSGQSAPFNFQDQRLQNVIFLNSCTPPSTAGSTTIQLQTGVTNQQVNNPTPFFFVVASIASGESITFQVSAGGAFDSYIQVSDASTPPNVSTSVQIPLQTPSTPTTSVTFTYTSPPGWTVSSS
jgi:hypothetical protein